MGAKRRAGSKSPVKDSASPKPKKAKVEEDPVEKMCQELVKFFTESEHVPESIEPTLTCSIKPTLSKLSTERHRLEQFYVASIGEVLRHCATAIDQEVAGAAAGVAAAEQDAAAKAAHVDKAGADGTVASENVGKAKTAEADAKTAADQADEDRVALQEEVDAVHVNKGKLDGEAQELQDGLTTLAGETLAKKEGAKLSKLLEGVGCSTACISAIPTSMGKTEGFEAMVLGEARKALQTKLDEVGQKLKDWDATVATAAQQLSAKDAQILALTDAHTQRKQELKNMQDAEKAAKLAKKDAEAALGKAKKDVNAKTKLHETACEKKATADSAAVAYAALSSRVAAPEPAPAEETAEPTDL